MQHRIVFVIIIIIVNTKDLFNANELETKVGQSMDWDAKCSQHVWPNVNNLGLFKTLTNCQH